jgi:KaiC/GvpD/RAD55 family RecA-like ATPase
MSFWASAVWPTGKARAMARLRAVVTGLRKRQVVVCLGMRNIGYTFEIKTVELERRQMLIAMSYQTRIIIVK